MAAPSDTEKALLASDAPFIVVAADAHSAPPPARHTERESFTSGTGRKPGQRPRGGQAEHPAAPRIEPYVALAQPTHPDAAGCQKGGHASGAQSAAADGCARDGVVPAAQAKAAAVHARDDVEPVESVVEPSGQRVQLLASVAAVSSEYVAYGHGVHAAVPVPLAYVPGAQAEHTDRPACDAA